MKITKRLLTKYIALSFLVCFVCPRMVTARAETANPLRSRPYVDRSLDIPATIREIQAMVNKVKKEFPRCIVSLKKEGMIFYMSAADHAIHSVSMDRYRAEAEYRAQLAEQNPVIAAMAESYSEHPEKNNIIQAHLPTAQKVVDGGGIMPQISPDTTVILDDAAPPPVVTDEGQAMAAAVSAALKDHRVVLTKKYGVFAAGLNFYDAWYKLGMVEDLAEMFEAAETFGGVVPLSAKRHEDIRRAGYETVRTARIVFGTRIFARPEEIIDIKVSDSTKRFVERARKDLITEGVRTDSEGLIRGPGGNNSILVAGKDIGGNEIKIVVIKATGECAGSMQDRFGYVAVDLATGKCIKELGDPGQEAPYRPSSETRIHRKIYEDHYREYCQEHREGLALAIAHTHPNRLTGIATARKTLEGVAWVDFQEPGSEECATTVSGKISKNCNAVVIANHGIFVIGRALSGALDGTIKLEQKAQTAVKNPHVAVFLVKPVENTSDLAQMAI